MNVDEIIWFLFLTHNQNTRVREELLKTVEDYRQPSRCSSNSMFGRGHYAFRRTVKAVLGHGEERCPSV